ncbi:hypothetical protein PSCICM_21500 [Pseudomonas cichorii]|nr:hypothetical protein PSCICM_21500 [Pseudomonas cichorii]
MIDTQHNQRLVKAYELIDFIGQATDLESLVLLFGRAYGYIEALRDAKILPVRRSRAWSNKPVRISKRPMPN